MSHLDSEVAMLQEQVVQLRRALESRDVIGQAKGIIMHSLGCDADEAFDVLVEQSRTENRKLVDVATDLVARSSRTGRAAASPAVHRSPRSQAIDGHDPSSTMIFTHRDGNRGPRRHLVDHGHDGGTDPATIDGDDHLAPPDR